MTRRTQRDGDGGNAGEEDMADVKEESKSTNWIK